MSQVFDYDVSNDSKTFLPFFDGVRLNSSIWDDPTFEFTSSFPLSINGTDYNSIKIAPEGTGGSLRFSNSDGEKIYIAFSLVDLADRGLNNPPKSKSTIRYKTTGGVGNRTFAIQYYNCGFFDPINDLHDGSDFIHIQLIFHEATDIIEVAYGDRNLPNYNKIIAATQGNSIAFFEDFDNNFYPKNVWYLKNAPALPEIQYLVNGQSLPNLWQEEPEMNRVIRYKPKMVSVKENNALFNEFFELYQQGSSLIFTSVSHQDYLEYTIFDLSGKELTADHLQGQEAVIPLENWASGNYLFVVHSASGVMSKQLYIHSK